MNRNDRARLDAHLAAMERDEDYRLFHETGRRKPWHREDLELRPGTYAEFEDPRDKPIKEKPVRIRL